MHIGLLTACYHPVVNGVVRMVDHYAAGFQSRGHRVSIFTIGRKTERYPGHHAEIWRTAGIPLGRSGYYAATRYPSDMQLAVKSCDVLHAHHPVMALDFASRYANHKITPIVFTNHTRYDHHTETYLPLWPKRFRTRVGRRLGRQRWRSGVEKATHVIACTDEIARAMREVGIKRPIKKIRNGIDIDRFTSPAHPISRSMFGWSDDRFVIVYTGRLAPEKRVDRLLTAFHIAHKKNHQLRLLLVGDGPERSNLESMIQALSLQQVTKLVGSVEYEEIPSYLAAADLFAMTSSTEVDPLSILEAAAAGLPVLALQEAWTAECVPSEIGFVCETLDELGHQMARLASETIIRNRISAAARTYASSRSIDRTIEDTLKLYDVLLGR